MLQLEAQDYQSSETTFKKYCQTESSLQDKKSQEENHSQVKGVIQAKSALDSSSSSSSTSSSDSESTNCSFIENPKQNKTVDEVNCETESSLLKSTQSEGKTSPDEGSKRFKEVPEVQTAMPVKNTAENSSSSSSSTSSSDSSSDSESTDGSFRENSDDSVKDPDYEHPKIPARINESDDTDSDSPRVIEPVPTTSNNVSTASGDIVTERTKKTRKRIANPSEWRQTKAKILRSAGLSYRTKKNVEVRARAIKPPCNEKCRLKCAEKITEDDRKAIFQAYWDLKDINRQRDMINKSMTAIQRKYKYSNAEKPRNPNQAFYFTVNGEKKRVCKVFFMNTLDINGRVIQTVLEKRTDVDTITEDNRGKHGKHKKLPAEVKEGVRKHIESIPRIESHYLRQQTSREFIDGGKTIADLHNDYKEECVKNGKLYANYVLYAKIFNTEYNLGFFVPKKDQCALCEAYSNAEGEEKEQLSEKYHTHIKEKELSREEKQKDKDSNDVVLVYDLQAVQQLPRGDVSVFYYKSKLNCLNFTITDLKTKKTECYFWHEGIGNRGADEIGSCVFRYIEMIMASYSEDSKVNLIFYSDNCCGQNKNQFIIALYLYCVMKFKNLNSITHKFLICGHTQNEGDAVHSVIEKNIKRNLKSGPIYVPSQYVQIIKTAKKSGEPYHVNELSYSDFVSLKKLANDLKLKLNYLLQEIVWR